MVSVTTRFLSVIRSSHRAAFAATLYPAAGGTVPIPNVTTGSVTIDRTATHRRRATLTIPLGAPTPAPYGDEIRLYRGVEYADGSTELASLGYYRVDEVAEDIDEASISITLNDRSQQIADEQRTQPKHFTSATKIEDAIATLITGVYPTATVHKPGVTRTFGKTTVADQDQWTAVTDFAAAIGCEVYNDSAGEWWIATVPDPSTASSVWTIDAGAQGVLVALTDTRSRSDIKNGVLATGEPLDSTAPASYLAVDNDSSSATYWSGAFGHVPDFLQSQLIRNNTQAQTAAEARLRDLLGQGHSISLSSVVNPALEAGDAVTVTRPFETGAVHLIDAVTIPLDTTSPLTITSRVQP